MRRKCPLRLRGLLLFSVKVHRVRKATGSVQDTSAYRLTGQFVGLLAEGTQAASWDNLNVTKPKAESRGPYPRLSRNGFAGAPEGCQRKADARKGGNAGLRNGLDKSAGEIGHGGVEDLQVI